MLSSTNLESIAQFVIDPSDSQCCHAATSVLVTLTAMLAKVDGNGFVRMFTFSAGSASGQWVSPPNCLGECRGRPVQLSIMDGRSRPTEGHMPQARS